MLSVSLIQKASPFQGDHVYRFKLMEGSWGVHFNSCESDYDTYLRVMTSDMGAELAGCDDCGPCGTRTVLDAELDCAQHHCNYVLVVEGYGSNEGSYSVTMTCNEMNDLEGTIACGETVASSTEGATNAVETEGSSGGDHMYVALNYRTAARTLFS